MAEQVNWGNVLKAGKENSFEPIPEGDYVVEITKTDTTLTKKNREHMINWQARVADGAYKGRQVFSRIVIPNAGAENFGQRAAFLVRDLKNMGISEQYLESSPSPDMVAEALKGRMFSIHVEIDSSYDGTPRNNVKRILKPITATGTSIPTPSGYNAATPPPPPAPPAPAAPAPPQPAAGPVGPSTNGQDGEFEGQSVAPPPSDQGVPVSTGPATVDSPFRPGG